jgi:hypothetical protein
MALAPLRRTISPMTRMLATTFKTIWPPKLSFQTSPQQDPTFKNRQSPSQTSAYRLPFARITASVYPGLL